MAFNSFPAKGGIPSGNTAARPSGPVIGDTYYDGTLGFLLIFDGTAFIPCSAPAAQPTITVADVGTNQPFTAPTATVTFTEGTAGGKAAGFTAIQSSVSATSTSSTITLTLTAPGTSLPFTGTSFNGFGTSPSSLTVNQEITSLPEVRTIGTATASTSENQVTVTWTNGNNGGKVLSAITITPFLNGTTAETSRTAATTSSTSYTFTLGQLTAGAAYTFKVKATNANGTCADSTATNSATMPNLFAVDYLVVAGGGGAAATHGGGGGGGGLRSTVTATGGGGTLETALNVAGSTNYTVTVGAGGTNAATNGSNSVFSSITSTGGGYGNSGGVGAVGGSGGGGGTSGNLDANAGGAGTANQGRAGGASFGYGSGDTRVYLSGGGGGANTAGTTATTGTSGVGGAGVAVSITGSSVTYAGGGGGATGRESGGANVNGGAGGAGGGGAGGTRNVGTAGTVNTGGGGGGGGFLAGSYAGGAGGSGVVILRYPDTQTITIGAGLTGTESAASGGYKRATLTAGTGNVSW